MPKAVVVKQVGGPEVLTVENVPDLPDPGQGQVLVRQTKIGVNFEDTYYRSGVYKLSKFPFTPGIEACGVVEKVGLGIKDVQPGQRVVYGTVPYGAYCEKRILPLHYLIGVPQFIDDNMAVSVFAKGLLAHALLLRCYQLRPGNVVLIHAVAGGVGQILCQWAKQLGAVVIGTVGSQEKVTIAQSVGCDYPVVYGQQNFAEVCKQVTKGLGVDVVYDSVGKDTIAGSMQALREMGLLVSYGQSSGAVPSVNLMHFASKGIYVTRPQLGIYKRERMELVLSANEVFNMVKKGKIRVNITKNYAFDQIQHVHADLHGRKTVGSSVITV